MSLIHVLTRTTGSEKAFLDAGLSDCSLILVEAATKVESFSVATGPVLADFATRL